MSGEPRLTARIGPAAHEDRTRLGAYNLLLKEYIQELLAEFDRSGIPVILFKGIALLNDVYTDISGRSMGDVDMLVRPEDMKRMVKVLENRGFSFIHGNMVNAMVLGTNDPAEIYIDLHRSLINIESPSQKRVYLPDHSAIWSRAVPVTFGNTTALVLSPEDRLCYLCFHILKERFSKDKWLRDIELFLEKKGPLLDIGKFIDIALENGTLKICAMTIAHISPSGPFDPVITKAREKYKYYAAEYALFKVLLSKPVRGVFPFREVLWLVAMDSAGKKAGFIKDLVAYVLKKFF